MPSSKFTHRLSAVAKAYSVNAVVQTEGSRQVQRPATLYKLDAMLTVGYWVRSKRSRALTENLA